MSPTHLFHLLVAVIVTKHESKISDERYLYSVASCAGGMEYLFICNENMRLTAKEQQH
jgi:hypothetical protein